MDRWNLIFLKLVSIVLFAIPENIPVAESEDLRDVIKQRKQSTEEETKKSKKAVKEDSDGEVEKQVKKEKKKAKKKKKSSEKSIKKELKRLKAELKKQKEAAERAAGKSKRRRSSYESEDEEDTDVVKQRDESHGGRRAVKSDSHGDSLRITIERRSEEKSPPPRVQSVVQV